MPPPQAKPMWTVLQARPPPTQRAQSFACDVDLEDLGLCTLGDKRAELRLAGAPGSHAAHQAGLQGEEVQPVQVGGGGSRGRAASVVGCSFMQGGEGRAGRWGKGEGSGGLHDGLLQAWQGGGKGGVGVEAPWVSSQDDSTRLSACAGTQPHPTSFLHASQTLATPWNGTTVPISHGMVHTHRTHPVWLMCCPPTHRWWTWATSSACSSPTHWSSSSRLVRGHMGAVRAAASNRWRAARANDAQGSVHAVRTHRHAHHSTQQVLRDSEGSSIRLVAGNTGPGVYKDWPVTQQVLVSMLKVKTC